MKLSEYIESLRTPMEIKLIDYLLWRIQKGMTASELQTHLKVYQGGCKQHRDHWKSYIPQDAFTREQATIFGTVVDICESVLQFIAEHKLNGKVD